MAMKTGIPNRDWLAEHYVARGVAKRAFPTFAAAQEAADKENARPDNGRPMHAYKCGYCAGFHLGHSNPKKWRRGR